MRVVIVPALLMLGGGVLVVAMLPVALLLIVVAQTAGTWVYPPRRVVRADEQRASTRQPLHAATDIRRRHPGNEGERKKLIAAMTDTVLTETGAAGAR